MHFFEKASGWSRTEKLFRFTLFILSIGTALAGPYSLALILASFLLIRFSAHEAILCGLILDALYGHEHTIQVLGGFFFTSVLVLLASVLIFLRPYIRKS